MLNSGAGRLILHGLSKWGREDRSHCSHYRMQPAVVPSAWIHMNGQTDLSLLSLHWKRLRCWAQTCIVHLWEHGPIVCLKVQSSVSKYKKKKDAVTSGLLLPNQRYNLVSVCRNIPAVMVAPRSGHYLTSGLAKNRPALFFRLKGHCIIPYNLSGMEVDGHLKC